ELLDPYPAAGALVSQKRLEWLCSLVCQEIAGHGRMNERFVDHARPPVVRLRPHRVGHDRVHARRSALEVGPVGISQGICVAMADLMYERLHEATIVDREGGRIGRVVAEDAVALQATTLRVPAVAE